MQKIVIAGGTGRTGQEVTRYLAKIPNLKIIGVLSRKFAGKTMDNVIADLNYTIPIYSDFQQLISLSRPTMLVDFTHPDVAKKHFEICIDNNINPIIGTTGFSTSEIQHFANLCVKDSIGGALIPNFSFGTLIMLQAARIAADIYSEVYIADSYPPHKLEIPSGTSKQMKAELQKLTNFINQDIPVNSLRISGVTPHQEIKFGGQGETLTICHNVSNRMCFGPGVAMAIKKISHFQRLITSLEELI